MSSSDDHSGGDARARLTEALAALALLEGVAPAPPLADDHVPIAPIAQPPYSLLGMNDRGELSVLEAVLSAGEGSSLAPVLGFLTQGEARPLRAASTACCAAVAEQAWGVEQPGSSRIMGWRRCFPRATWADMRLNVADSDMVHLRGIHALIMSHCEHITDAGLAYLRGIHTLEMSRMIRITQIPSFKFGEATAAAETPGAHPFPQAQERGHCALIAHRTSSPS